MWFVWYDNRQQYSSSNRNMYGTLHTVQSTNRWDIQHTQEYILYMYHTTYPIQKHQKNNNEFVIYICTMYNVQHMHMYVLPQIYAHKCLSLSRERVEGYISVYVCRIVQLITYYSHIEVAHLFASFTFYISSSKHSSIFQNNDSHSYLQTLKHNSNCITLVIIHLYRQQ